jgi:hypothetical protein
MDAPHHDSHHHQHSPPAVDGEAPVLTIEQRLEELRHITITTNRVLLVIVMVLVILSFIVVFVPPCTQAPRTTL